MFRYLCQILIISLLRQLVLTALLTGRQLPIIKRKPGVAPGHLDGGDFLMNSRGLSLMEVFVSLLILATVVAGVVGSFVSSQRLISSSYRRLQAANLSRQFLEILRTQVSADPAQSLMLVPKPWAACGINLGAFGNSPFNATCEYQVAAVGVTFDVRRVDVRIRWTEP